MQIRAEEISSIIKNQINDYESKVEVAETGTVLSVGDGIARIYGLRSAMAGEMIEFDEGTRAIVLNLEEGNVGVAIMGSGAGIREGSTAKRTGEIAQVPVGPALLGRVVDALGRPVDGQGDIETEHFSKMEVKAPGILPRQSVHEPMQTGIKAIDSMFRLVVVSVSLSSVTVRPVRPPLRLIPSSQKGQDVKCINVAIGQKQSTIAQVVEKLKENGAMEYTTVVSAPAASPAPMQFLSPYCGVAMGEYFRDNGQHALIVYDDLSKQSVAYRELSLLLRRPPGREAFPGDVFYVHSRLLERAAKLNAAEGGGSLTALPIIETQADDVARLFRPTSFRLQTVRSSSSRTSSTRVNVLRLMLVFPSLV